MLIQFQSYFLFCVLFFHQFLAIGDLLDLWWYKFISSEDTLNKNLQCLDPALIINYDPIFLEQ